MNALPNIRQKTCGIFFRQSLVVRIAGYYICGRFCSEGRIAQPVQSICLTSRGSEVRILLRPQSHLVFQGGFFFFIAIPQGGSAHPDLHREGRSFESFCAHKATSIFRVAFSFIAMPQGGSAHPGLIQPTPRPNSKLFRSAPLRRRIFLQYLCIIVPVH